MRIGDFNQLRRILFHRQCTRPTAKVTLLDGIPAQQAAVCQY